MLFIKWRCSGTAPNFVVSNIDNNNKIIYTMKHNYYFKLFLIAIALFVSQSVWAQWSGNGTQANPYKINDTGDWNTLCDKVYKNNSYSGKYFELTNDITVSRCVEAIHRYHTPYEH